MICAAGGWSAALLQPSGSASRSGSCARPWPGPPGAADHPGGRVGPRGRVSPAAGRRHNLAAGGATDYDVTLDPLRHIMLFLPNYWKNRALFRFHVGRPLWRDLGRLWPASERRRHPFTHDRDVEPPPNPDKVQRGLAEFLRLFPGVRGLTIERSWAGYIDATRTRCPCWARCRVRRA